MEERRYSLKEAKEILGISERTIHRWIKSGKLKSYKPGRDHQIPESAIREVIERSEVYPKDLEPSLPFEPAAEEGIADKVYRLGELLWRGWDAEYEDRMKADDSEWFERVTATINAYTDILRAIDVTQARDPEALLARARYMHDLNERWTTIVDPEYRQRFSLILEESGERMEEMIASG